ncbi:hypothetical protein GCM10025881_37480 [Pseudolysinimonas kribbensis]|uniref:Signal transduction histidine kinase subgroup 3 dimerisation and phosphoacceptor domain-containing protein n=1 Tax=Pseudolysinimonas kribbensis TaxID=433641 RepID=A0ABQ6KCM6_9MICO|nr:hypothetical protein GCM10025881_37480 [Pseudolysinimonas kribbensis]
MQARLDRQQLERVEDRSRIARDLHDHVIQRLFGAGLTLQAEATRTSEGSRGVILEQVNAIDAAIAEIRTVIFALSSPPAGSSALRHRVLDAVSEAGAGLPTPPRLTFDGAVDLIVPAEMVEDVVAVVRESVTNVARHARASHTDVGVQVDDDHVTIRIDDDGIGYAPGDARVERRTSLPALTDSAAPIRSGPGTPAAPRCCGGCHSERSSRDPSVPGRRPRDRAARYRRAHQCRT